MRLIHITDLHYTRGNAFQLALIGSLVADLGKLHESGYVPDFLVFSGDLVNDPDEDKIYEEFEERFLHPILKSLRLRTEEVIFCPGNHDVSRRALREWADERNKLVKAMAADQTELDKYLQAQPTKAYVSAVSTGFFDLARRCGHAWTNPLVHHYSYPAKKTSFIALNTAYGCGLEGSQHDRGKLVLSGNQVLGAFQEKPKDHQAISLMHHSLNDLAESATRLLNPILAKQSAMHLFGHVHQAFPAVVSTSSASCFMIQGGALYERNGQYNGYSYVASSNDSLQIAASYRTYYVDRQEFDVGINVAPEGTFYNTTAAKSYWETLLPAPSNDDVCLWLFETSDSIAKQFDTTITGKSLTNFC